MPTVNVQMVERKRHLAKAVTYRILGSVGTTIVAYAATGDARIGASIGVLDSVVKIGFYYVHERIWHRIQWGVRPRPHLSRGTSEAPRDTDGNTDR